MWYDRRGAEESLRGVLDYCFDAGVRDIICFSIGLTLREGNREYFYQKLDQHFPGLKDKYHRKYGYSYEVRSDRSPELMRLFHDECERRGVMHNIDQVFSYMRTYESRLKAE